MTSTYMSYKLLTKDLTKTLARTAAEPEIKREAEYYKANIGNIKSVDEFLKNDRLFSYAMRAYGLTDMIKSKAFMAKVLKSDLTDQRSFARSLADTRYTTFARAFNFTTTGTLTPNLVDAQSDAQETLTVGLYSEARVRSGQKAATDVAYYESRIGTITTVDAFVADDTLMKVALTAFGIDASIASRTAIKEALTSDLDDPNSRANKLGDKYVALAKAFGFGTDGKVAAGDAQNADTIATTIIDFYDKSGNGASPKAGAYRTQFYESRIASITSAEQLTGDDRLLSVVLTAYGFDPAIESPANILQALKSDLSDPSSFAMSSSDTRYRAIAEAFNFAPDGTVSSPDGAQSSAKVQTLLNTFIDKFDDKVQQQETSETSYFTNKMAVAGNTKAGTLMKVDDLLKDTRLYNYLLKSFDIDPATESRDKIRRVLTSDLSKPGNFAASLRDERYTKLAAALNVSADGTFAPPAAAQSLRDEELAIRLYGSRVSPKASEAEKAAAKAEMTFYHEALAKIDTVDELLADKRLVKFIIKAYGFGDTTIADKTLKAVLTSNVDDAKSFANTQGDTRYRDMAAAFNFAADGTTKRLAVAQVQTKSDFVKTSELYLQQAMETDAGAENEGVRLALYFKRKAPNLNSTLEILADKALLEVVRTSMGMPASFSQLDIDKQVAAIEKRVKFEDFKDPAKLEKFLTRFGALYDQTNLQQTAGTSITQLFQSNSTGIGEGLLSSLQGLRLNR